MAEPPGFVPPTYLTAPSLRARLTDPTLAEQTLVVDVRDEGFEASHITGALHAPSAQFGEAATFAKIHQVATTGSKSLVVVHCMRSEVRGPTCARVLAEWVARANVKVAGADLAEAGASSSRLSHATSFPPIAILQGGFNGWAQYVAALDAKAGEGDERSRLIIGDFDARAPSVQQP